MRRRAILAATIGIGTAVSAAACGLAVTGTGGDAPVEDGAPPANDASTSSAEGAATQDGATHDGAGNDGASNDAADAGDAGPADGATSDATVDATLDGGCLKTVNGYGEGGTMEAFSVQTAPTVDGVLDDWGCVPFYPLSSANAYVASATSITGAFALQWTSSHLYFAMKVDNKATPAGNDGTDPFQNDSIELYLLQDNSPTGAYRTHDHHYIVDYKNLLADYDISRTTPPGTDIQAKVVVKGTTYSVEISVTAAALGHATLAASKMGFDVELNHSVSSMQTGVLLYGVRSGASTTNSQCGGGTELPWCNTHANMELSLLP